MSRLSVYSIILLGIASVVGGCDTQFGEIPGQPAYFVRYLGTDGNQTAVDFVPLTDGFLVLGQSSSPTGNKVFLSRLDAQGFELWSQVYRVGEQAEYYPKALVPSSDGNLVVTGNCIIEEEQNVFLMRIDGISGAETETVIFGEPGIVDEANDIIEVTDDNSFIIAGSSVYNLEDESTGMTAWRTEPGYSFNMRTEDVWTRTYKKGDVNLGVGITEDRGVYYMFGTSNGNTQQAGLTANNITIYPISENGINSQQAYFGTPNDDFGIMIINDVNRFVLLGKTVSGSVESYFIQQVSPRFYPLSSFNLISQRQVTPTAVAVSGADFVVLGTEDAFIDDTDIYVSKVSNDGTLLWERSFGGENLDFGSSGIFTQPDGSIVFVATIELEKQFKIALFKISADGNLN